MHFLREGRNDFTRVLRTRVGYYFQFTTSRRLETIFMVITAPLVRVVHLMETERLVMVIGYGFALKWNFLMTLCANF